MANRLAIGALVAAVGVGGLAGSWATARTGRSPFGKVGSVAMLVASENGDTVGKQVSFLNGFAPVAKRVLPAVVNIASTKIIRSPDQGPASPFFSDPFFRQFFGDEFSQQFRIPRQQREHSLGSGVIVSADGYILTNNHVVSGADDIEVSLDDKRDFKGRIVGTDAKTDVAVVKIEGKDLPVLTFGDSSKVQVGDFALAVGNPFGIPVTLAELPGNPQTSGSEAPGAAPGPRLGISVDQLTPQIARQLGLPAQATGVVVTDVQSASPAEEAGLRRGDVIQEVDRKPVTSVTQFRSAVQLAGTRPVLLLVNRGGDHVYVVVEPK